MLFFVSVLLVAFTGVPLCGFAFFLGVASFCFDFAKRERCPAGSGTELGLAANAATMSGFTGYFCNGLGLSCSSSDTIFSECNFTNMEDYYNDNAGGGGKESEP